MIHDGQGLAGNASVRVDLLQDLVDVDGVRLSSSSALLLVTSTGGLRLAGDFLRSLRRWLGRHSCVRALSATNRTDSCRTNGVDVSRPLLDDEDESRIVLGVGVRLFTVDASVTRSSRR